MTSPFLNIIEPDKPCDDIHSDILTKFPYPLDPFQKHAAAAIEKGHNVLCCAKTGSGKSTLIELLVHHTLAAGKRIFITTPIKSLSNQKFHDLKALFPSVGILTGDIKFCPDAQVIIMTTEILRNLLYKQKTSTAHLGWTAQVSLEGLGAVVFDEVHYINDPERGKVWEETLILLPTDIQLVLLSATIDRPELFGAWLADLKQRHLALISTTYRVVPLIHQVLLGEQPQTLMDAKNSYNGGVYSSWLQWRESKRKQKDTLAAAVNVRRAGGYMDPVVKGSGGLPAFSHQLNSMVNFLTKKELLPSLFFVFSRAGCEKYARTLEGSLIDSSDAAAVKHIWDFHLHRYKETLETLPQAHQLLTLLERGIAFHHSGLLPILREIVEILFGKGLIKALFATETFAVGINMPTRSVVFLDLYKYSDECRGMRLLRTDEYIQMAGRAGRRGKDPIGYVFYLPQKEPVEESEMRKMLTGRQAVLDSKMDFGYDFLLKVLQADNLHWMDILQKSYWNQQRLRQIAGLQEDLAKVELKIAEMGLTDAQKMDCQEREYLEGRLRETTNAARRDCQRGLDAWKNRHCGPVWETAWAKWKQMRALLDEKKEIIELLAEVEKTEDRLEPRLRFLETRGFLDTERKLTLKGVLATEVNEGHPLLASEAFLAGWTEALEPAELCAFLAAFLGEGREDTAACSPDNLVLPARVKDCLWKLDGLASDGLEAEQRILGSSANETFWALDTTWIEICYRWYLGEPAAVLCSEYGVFEGNFVRSILKLANLVEEWIALATYTQKVELLAKYDGMRNQIVRDLVQPDSLYLRL